MHTPDVLPNPSTACHQKAGNCCCSLLEHAQVLLDPLPPKPSPRVRQFVCRSRGGVLSRDMAEHPDTLLRYYGWVTDEEVRHEPVKPCDHV